MVALSIRVGSIQGGKKHLDEGGAVLASIDQMREALPCVPVSPDALGKAKPGRQARDDRHQPPRLGSTLRIGGGFPCCVHAVRGEVEADQVLEVFQRLGQGQTSLKWYSTIAVLSGTLAPAGTFFKSNDKICPAD